jgi:hypothetical protein
MGNTNTNNTNNNTTVEDVYEEDRALAQEETTICVAYGSEAQIPRIGILDEIEDKEIARWGRAGGSAPAEEIARWGRAGGSAPAEEIARWGTSIGGAGANGGATPIMDKINTSTSIEDRIQILSGEMIKRGLETEESFKRLRSYEKKRSEYRCLMEELARYYDRQTALGLPIEKPVLKTGIYMQHVILL